MANCFDINNSIIYCRPRNLILFCIILNIVRLQLVNANRDRINNKNKTNQ